MVLWNQKMEMKCIKGWAKIRRCISKPYILLFTVLCIFSYDFFQRFLFVENSRRGPRWVLGLKKGYLTFFWAPTDS